MLALLVHVLESETNFRFSGSFRLAHSEWQNYNNMNPENLENISEYFALLVYSWSRKPEYTKHPLLGHCLFLYGPLRMAAL